MYHNRVAGNRPGFARQLQLQIILTKSLDIVRLVAITGSVIVEGARTSVSVSPGEDVAGGGLLTDAHNPAQPGTRLVELNHAALPVDGEKAGAALEPDDALPEVVPADLEPQPQHRGEGVVVLLADLLRPQVVVPGLLLVDEPGEVGWRVGLPGGAQSFQSFANLVFFFYPRNSRLFIRQIDDLHVRRLDEGEEGRVGHHLAAVAPGVVEVDIPQEQCLPVRQQAINIKVIQLENFGGRCFICDEAEDLEVSPVPLHGPHLVSSDVHVPAAVEGGGVASEHDAGHAHAEVAQTTRTFNKQQEN